MRLRVYAKLAINEPYAVFEIDQRQTAMAPRLVYGESAPVVEDTDLDLPIVASERDIDTAHVRVSHGVA